MLCERHWCCATSEEGIGGVQANGAGSPLGKLAAKSRALVRVSSLSNTTGEMSRGGAIREWAWATVVLVLLATAVQATGFGTSVGRLLGSTLHGQPMQIIGHRGGLLKWVRPRGCVPAAWPLTNSELCWVYHLP